MTVKMKRTKETIDELKPLWSERSISWRL